ncbi:hypothetical protein BOX15_Mlig011782g1, partial [Macrostomum lignano]
ASHILPRVILLGDSLTQFGWSSTSGWVARIADSLARRCDIVNRGFSGYNSRWCRLIAPDLFPADSLKTAVAAFVIFLGANDSNRAGSTTQHLPTADYEAELVRLADYLTGPAGLSRDALIFCSPPPVDGDAWDRCCQERFGTPGTKTLEDVPPYRDACRRAAEAAGATFCNTYDGFLEHGLDGDWRGLFCDGLHFGPAGAERMFDLLWPEIHRRTERLPQLAPEWRTVDPGDLDASLVSLMNSRE